MSKLPIYQVDMPAVSGLYLGLFHGRNHPNQQLFDWGSNGPLIGPLKKVHSTYAADIKLEFIDKETCLRNGFDPDSMNCLEIEQGMVHFNNHWYGDWTLFYHQQSDLSSLGDIVLPKEVIHG